MAHLGDLRARAVDAADVLNDFLGDFVASTKVLRDYSAKYNQKTISLMLMAPVQKMCLSNAILAFAKFEEFWQHYSDVVPGRHRDNCKAILREIRERKTTDFRNHCIGHIWNKQERRPLAHSEVMVALGHVLKQDINAFLDWISNPTLDAEGATVVSLIEAVRDDICAEHKITPEELIER